MKKHAKKLINSDELEFLKEPDFSPAIFEMTAENPESDPPLVIYLYKEIGTPENYIELVHCLQYAPEEQDITIHINSPGGSLHSCLSIVNAMHMSSANIHTVLDGDASSASAFIWLAGHSKSIASIHVNLMIHSASCGFNVAKLSDITTSIKSASGLVEGLLDSLSTGLLTEEERADIRRGVDINLSGTEIISRLENEYEETDIE
jgi:ATP-dependent protease ClpP protease subunit